MLVLCCVDGKRDCQWANEEGAAGGLAANRCQEGICIGQMAYMAGIHYSTWL